MRTDNNLPCPECGSSDGKILSSRISKFRGFNAKLRRRECQSCGHRWSTRELSESDLGKADLGEKQFQSHVRSLKMLNRQISYALAECGADEPEGLGYEPEPIPPAIEQLAEALVGFLSSRKDSL